MQVVSVRAIIVCLCGLLKGWVARVSLYTGQREAKSQGRLLEVESSVSREYCDFMTSGFACTPRNRSKAIGQFLTPKQVYESMIRDVIQGMGFDQHKTLRVIDPFCGDARLLVEFISTLSSLPDHPERLEVVAWDIDANILAEATSSLQAAACDSAIEIAIAVEQSDAFDCDIDQYGTFDICLTNPPWSSTKSLKAKAFDTRDAYDRYQEIANAYGRLLTERYPEVKGGRTFGAGALNLSRFGLALSLRLVNETGICGIVMPSSFAADTTSALLRESMLDHFELRSMHYYPAELKLFAGADQAAVYLVMGAAKGAMRGKVTSHLKSKTVAYDLDDLFWSYSRNNGWIIPLGYGDAEIRLMEKLSLLPPLGSHASITLGREVDETRISERLCELSPYRFVKGFMITCYRLSDADVWYYDGDKAPIPNTALGEKVVWRDVSRVSQKKRVQATLLGPGHVAGNSLGVATCADSNALRSLLGVLNSSVFEFMARTVLTTNHVSSGMLKRVPYPSMDAGQQEQLAAAVDLVIANPFDYAAQKRVELLVAQAYGLSEDELAVAQEAIQADGQLTMELLGAESA